MSIDRAQFKAHGARMDGEYFNWNSSYVEYEGGHHFCPDNVHDKKSTHLAQGNVNVEPNSLFFTGIRQFNVDAPIYVTGTDVIRFAESDYCRREEEPGGLLSTEVEREAALKKYLVDACRGDVNKLLSIDGFYAMSMDAKRRYVSLCGFPALPDDQLVQAMPLEGLSAVAVGGFPDKQEVITFVESNGGVCTLEKGKNQKVTHVILGESGTTQYGQKTGLGSKKYTEAKKGGALVVDFATIQKYVTEKIDWRAEVQAAGEKAKEEAAAKKAEKAAKAAEAPTKKAKVDEEEAIPARRSTRARK